MGLEEQIIAYHKAANKNRAQTVVPPLALAKAKAVAQPKPECFIYPPNTVVHISSAQNDIDLFKTA